MTERRFFLPDLAETRVDEGTGELIGFAAVFFDPSDPDNTQFTLWDDRESGGVRMVERVHPRAFNRAVKRERQNVMGLFNHDSNNVLGRFPGTMRLEVLPRGLFYRVKPSERTIWKDVSDMVRAGDVPGSSFGFVVTKENVKTEGDKTEIREITDLDLIDVGPTPFPAYTGTSAAMRIADPESIAELRRKVDVRAAAKAEAEAATENDIALDVYKCRTDIAAATLRMGGQ